MTAASEQDTIWLTQEAYDKLAGRARATSSGPVRQEIIERISAARDEGDLKENGGYHAAKDEQGKIEARIRQLEDMLRRAEVGETPADDGVVEPGMVVTYKFVGDDDVETFLLGAREIEDDPEDSTSTRRSPRSARRSSAPRRATRSPTPRPTARSSRSRSSTRCPTPADHQPSRRPATVPVAGVVSGGRVEWLLDTCSRARAAGRAPARSAASPRVSSCSVHLDLVEVQASAEIRSCTTSITLAPTSASSASSRARPPGRSGMRTRRHEVAPGGGHAVPDHLAEQQRVDVAAGEHHHGRRLERGRVVEHRGDRRPRRPARRPAWPARASSSSARDSDSSETVTISSTCSLDRGEGDLARAADRDAVGHRAHRSSGDRARPRRASRVAPRRPPPGRRRRARRGAAP